MDKQILIDQLPTHVYFSDIFSSDTFIEYCKNCSRVVILTDSNVAKHHAFPLTKFLNAHDIKNQTITIPAGESSKTRETKAAIEDKMFSSAYGRDTLIIALGGGVVTDLAGFVAATYCRGIPVIYIPTSLLAMVDACIGGKTGINTSFGKNTLGTFTHPRAIFIDVNFLQTLPNDEYVSAISEIIKHALIGDVTFFSWVEDQVDSLQAKNLETVVTVIHKSCAIKASVVSDDEKEMNKREMLNFGHTIAHAIEAASDYSVSHGQGVAMGIMAESFISHEMGYLSSAEFIRIQDIMFRIFPENYFNIKLPENDILQALRFDKKNRQQKNRYVLLKQIGSVLVKNENYAHQVDAVFVMHAVNYLSTLRLPELQ